MSTLANPAARLNIKAWQGQDYVLSLEDEATDTTVWTGATLQGNIKKAPDTSGAALATFAGAITGTRTGTVTLTDTQLDAISVDAQTNCEFNSTCYVYEIEIVYADGTVQPLLYGRFDLFPKVYPT